MFFGISFSGHPPKIALIGQSHTVRKSWCMGIFNGVAGKKREMEYAQNSNFQSHDDGDACLGASLPLQERCLLLLFAAKRAIAQVPLLLTLTFSHLLALSSHTQTEQKLEERKKETRISNGCRVASGVNCDSARKTTTMWGRISRARREAAPRFVSFSGWCCGCGR